jgi:Peptidase family M23
MGTRGRRAGMRSRLMPLAVLAVLVVGALATATPAFAAPTRTVQFRLPWAGGQSWRIAQNWGPATCGGTYTGSHCGRLNQYAYDFDPAGTHLPIVAVADGTVDDVTIPSGAKCSTLEANAGLAITVRIKHADGTYSLYVHLTSVFVKETNTVKQGQIIGTSGCTGHTEDGRGGTFEHLHFSREWKDSSGLFWTMPTSFQDVPASGTLASPKNLSTNPVGTFGYTSLNPCSQDTSKPIGDANAVPVGQYCARFYRDKNIDSTSKYWSAMSTLNPNSFFSDGTWPFQTSSAYAPYFTATTFSARWVMRYNFTAATWNFHLTTSDGIKVYIDNMTTPVYSSWVNRSSVFSNDFARSMTAGYHLIKVEYYDDGNGPSEFSFDFDNCTSLC